MEELFIGTKIVAAEPMSEKEHFGGKGVDVSPERPDRPGYQVRYEDGYISWSPKETFERAYRKVTIQEAEMVSSGQFVIPDSSGSTMKVA
jgi:hypothetical protein